MGRPGLVGAAALIALSAGARAEGLTLAPGPLRVEPRPGVPPHRGHERYPSRFFPRAVGRPRIGPFPPLPVLPPAPLPDENLPPPIGRSPPMEGSPGPEPGLPHGFHLTVFIGEGWSHRAPARLYRFAEVGETLATCFVPPSGVAWGSITLRVSFRRDGAVFGEPRLPYIDAATPEQKAALARSLLAALRGCAPLHVSPTLGAAIAGEIFAVRFIHQDQR